MIKDVNILDEQTIPHISQPVTLIVGEGKESRVLELLVQRSTNFEKMVTFQVRDIAYPPKLSFSSFNSVRNIIINLRNKLLNIYSQFAPPSEYQDPVFDMRFLVPNNIAHLMFQAIPFCLHVKKYCGPNTKFLFAKPAPVFKSLLEVFDIQPITTHRKIFGSIVKIFGTRRLAAYDISDVPDSPQISFIPNIYDNYKFVSPLKEKEKLFIARRDGRSLINQDSIESILNKHGYKTVYMEDYTMIDKLAIASEARDVVALHGAAIALFAVNNQLNSLIEICPPNNYYDYYPVSLAGRIKKHIQIMPRFDYKVAYSGWDAILNFKSKPFYLMESQIELALSLIEQNS